MSAPRLDEWDDDDEEGPPASSLSDGLDGVTLLPWQVDISSHVLGPEGGRYAIAGGRGSGKSLEIDYLACMLAINRPGSIGGLVMDNFGSITKIHQPHLRALAPSVGGRWSVVDKAWYFTTSRGTSSLFLAHLNVPNGWIEGGTPIEGWNCNWLLGDELSEVDPRYWQTFGQRARIPWIDKTRPPGHPLRKFRPVVVTCGLPKNTWWCGQTKRRGGKVWRPTSFDNSAERGGHLGEGEVESMMADMTERQIRSLIYGDDLVSEGAIYSDGFIPSPESDGGSITSTLDGPAVDWSAVETKLSVDPGDHIPFVTLFARKIGTLPWIIVDSWTPAPNSGAVSTTSMCQRVLRDTSLRAAWGPRMPSSRPGRFKMPIDDIIMDPAGNIKYEPSRESYLERWSLPQPEGFGYRPRFNRDPAKTSVEVGIQRTQLAFERRRMLMSAELYERCVADAADARNILRCLLNYRWNAQMDAPVKKDGNDDGADTVRYMVMGSDLWDDGRHAALVQAYATPIPGVARPAVNW